MDQEPDSYQDTVEALLNGAGGLGGVTGLVLREAEELQPEQSSE